ncbi:VOC family protein [Lysobacter yangpyeongensis]|uniref:VOC family protein n=1 Tax=Lysobacter yangpyeongensis TaxID=346182 RepID=A0ABW0SLA4_9GAMM
MLIDCNTPDIDAAADFWAQALGRAVDPDHPGTRGNYRMLETPPDEPIVQIQRVAHESRVHIDIETDDIPAEVARLEGLGATVVDPWNAGWSCRPPADSGSASCGCNGRDFRRTRISGPDREVARAVAMSRVRRTQAGAACSAGRVSRIGRFAAAASRASTMSAYHIHV